MTGSDARDVPLIVERSVPVPMRDGVQVCGDVWRPAGQDPVHVLATRTPYNRAMLGSVAATHLARAGFAVLQQDCRGRFESEGEGLVPGRAGRGRRLRSTRVE